MNVLIVNGFPEASKSFDIFEDFVKSIKKIMKKYADIAGIDKVQYFIRDHKNIDDFLIMDSDVENSRKRFDSLDFIFFDGCEKYLPWKKNGYKFSSLLRMAKVSNKSVFACETGMQILIYFLATNFNNDMTIFNAHSEIESIEDIHKIPKKFLSNIKKNDYFLDYVTGDTYEFRKFTNDWDPIMNIGLHKQKMTEKYMDRGKYLLNPVSLRPKSVSGKIEQKFSSMNTEIKVTVQKNNLFHWLLKGLPLDFIALTNLSWYSHNISHQSSELEIHVLCESEKGYMVIEHGSYIGLSFHVFSKYKDTITILDNFVRKKFNDTYGNIGGGSKQLINDIGGTMTLGKWDGLGSKNNMIDYNRAKFMAEIKSMTNTAETPGGFSQLSRPTSSNLVMTSGLYSKKKHADRIANHCGMGFNNRDKIYVDYNSVSTRPVTGDAIGNSNTHSVNGFSAKIRHITSGSIKEVNARASTNTLNMNKNFSPRTQTSHPRQMSVGSNFFASEPGPGSPSKKVSPRMSSTKAEQTRSPFRSPLRKKTQDKKGENYFGENGNLFYNGELKTLRLIGPPSENNRVAKVILEESKTKFSPKKKVLSVEELKYISNNHKNVKDVGGYINFIDKGSLQEEQLFEYVKNKKVEIYNQLRDIESKNEQYIKKKTLEGSLAKNATMKKKLKSTGWILEHTNPSTQTYNNFFKIFNPPKKEIINQYLNKKHMEDRNGQILSENNLYLREEKEKTDRRVGEEETEVTEHYKEDFDADPTSIHTVYKSNKSKDKYMKMGMSPKRAELMANKELWVGKDDFRRVFSKSPVKRYSVTPTYTYLPKGSHTFRDTDKKKWMVTRDKEREQNKEYDN